MPIALPRNPRLLASHRQVGQAEELPVVGILWQFVEIPWKVRLGAGDGTSALSIAIDRKLMLTAALLGAVGRKDLAAAFRRANPATTFDLARAHKWLQGRARPRDSGLYDDWAAVLGLDRPGSWVAACSLDEFVDALCARGPMPREVLLQRAAAFGGTSGRAPELHGRYVCYSHAWSPYFRGRLIRGELVFGVAGDGRRVGARYTEYLPTRTIRFDGAVTRTERAIYLDLRAPDGVHVLLCLFRANPPWSVLGGLMCGATVIGPDSQPSATRIVMVRLPDASAAVPDDDPYLPPGASIAGDLERLGMGLRDRDLVETAIRRFIEDGPAGGLDQIGPDAYKALVDLFDRHWLARGNGSASPSDLSRPPW
jgi:hypothetical protein